MLVIWSTDGTVWESRRVNYHDEEFSLAVIQKSEGDGQLSESVWVHGRRQADGDKSGGGGAAALTRRCAHDSGPARLSSREWGRTAGVQALEKGRPPSPGASVSHRHGNGWGFGLQGSGAKMQAKISINTNF